MHPTLYRAAIEGNANVLGLYIDQLISEVTPNENTVLHVATQFGCIPSVLMILERCPALLRTVNIKGETALHIAAREGHTDIAKVLIDFAKELDQELESGGGAARMMLRATNEDGDMALHMAVRNPYHLDVVRLLTREDPEYTHPANNANETPLYLAAERGYEYFVFVILENCPSPGYIGPDGRTALHAAVFLEHTVSTHVLLGSKPDLIKEADGDGWTPIHYVACNKNVNGIRQLLEVDLSYAYVTTRGNHQTAFHIAAGEGNIIVMEELLLRCPDCWEMVDNKRQNVLHIAAHMEKETVIKFILKMPWLRYLINQKDADGNTPLHLHAMSENIVQELFWHPIADKLAVNNNNLTPGDVRLSTGKGNIFKGRLSAGRNIVSNDKNSINRWNRARKEQILKERRNARAEVIKRMGKTHLIVATLIATVAFAAGFTMPGGYDSNGGPQQGTPVLIREAAFQAFVITNTIAVICSTSSGFLYASASFYNDEDKQSTRYLTAFGLIIIAMIALVLAFITGTYSVLANSFALAIATTVIACISFNVYFLELKKLYQKFGVF